MSNNNILALSTGLTTLSTGLGILLFGGLYPTSPTVPASLIVEHSSAPIIEPGLNKRGNAKNIEDLMQGENISNTGNNGPVASLQMFVEQKNESFDEWRELENRTCIMTNILENVMVLVNELDEAKTKIEHDRNQCENNLNMLETLFIEFKKNVTLLEIEYQKNVTHLQNELQNSQLHSSIFQEILQITTQLIQQFLEHVSIYHSCEAYHAIKEAVRYIRESKLFSLVTQLYHWIKKRNKKKATIDAFFSECANERLTHAICTFRKNIYGEGSIAAAKNFHRTVQRPMMSMITVMQ
jgi:hypothetical protein